MNITSLLKINSSPVLEIKKTIRLELKTPGRGIFTVKQDEAPKAGQLIESAMQLGETPARTVFIGFIETVTPIQRGVFQVLAREPAAALNRPLPLSLRHCTPQQILTAISEITGLQFVLPKSDWVKEDVPRFQHTGGGYGALDNLLRVFSVPRGIWQQQTDGRIYVGELDKSPSGGKAIEIQAEFLNNMSSTGGDIPAIPRLRPGVEIKINSETFFITSIDVAENTMRLQWDKNPFDKKLRGIQ